MLKGKNNIERFQRPGGSRALLVLLFICFSLFSGRSQEMERTVSPVKNNGTKEIVPGLEEMPVVLPDSLNGIYNDSIPLLLPDSTLTRVTIENEKVFNPDPMRAVWLSALCPGLGQIYNRRYWKLPIVIGGYAGLIYATSWNGRMLKDYQNGYRDIMDSDPATNSYMNFYPSTVKEEDIDKDYLKNVLKQRKDFYRRNRDLCIISMVGVYLVCMIDAYVDAQLYHFDITPDLSVRWNPAVIESYQCALPSVGIQCAITF
ncbi:MAG: DUF5683 domain-containing protein [Barnesiella sp.]